MTDDEIKCVKSWLDELAELRAKVGYYVDENARLLKCMRDGDELSRVILSAQNIYRNGVRK